MIVTSVSFQFCPCNFLYGIYFFRFSDTQEKVNLLNFYRDKVELEVNTRKIVFFLKKGTNTKILMLYLFQREKSVRINILCTQASLCSLHANLFWHRNTLFLRIYEYADNVFNISIYQYILIVGKHKKCFFNTLV